MTGPVAPGDVPVLEGLDVSTYTVPTDAPEADGTLSWDSTGVVLVTARAAGEQGIGWTYAPAAAGALVRDVLAPVVTGTPVTDTGAATAAMAHAVRNDPRPGLVGYAIAAVDCALWDLKARVLGIGLAELIGRVHQEVPVYGSGGFISYSDRQLADQLGGWVHGQGIPRAKIKIGHARDGGREADTARDAAWIRRARAIIGGDAELFVDANGAYRVKQAIGLMARAADADVRWFEEPVSSDHLTGLRQVRDAVSAEVAAGEYGTDLFSFARLCAADAVDCLQVDVSRCGGITAWMRIAALAAAHGLDVSGHCAPHLSAAVAAATPHFRHLEWFHDHVRIENLFFDGTLDPAGGSITPDRGAPGNGLTVRTADIERFRTG